MDIYHGIGYIIFIGTLGIIAIMLIKRALEQWKYPYDN